MNERTTRRDSTSTFTVVPPYRAPMTTPVRAKRKTEFWSLYQKDGTKYLENNSYYNAWCSGCVQEWVSRTWTADMANLASGHVTSVRSREQLTVLGKSYCMSCCQSINPISKPTSPGM